MESIRHVPSLKVGIIAPVDETQLALVSTYTDRTEGQAQIAVGNRTTLHLSGTPDEWRHLAKVIEDAAMELEGQMAPSAAEHYAALAAEARESA